MSIAFLDTVRLLAIRLPPMTELRPRGVAQEKRRKSASKPCILPIVLRGLHSGVHSRVERYPMLRRSLVPALVLVCLSAFAPGGAVSAQERISVEGDVKFGNGSLPNQRLEVLLMSMASMETKRGSTDKLGKFNFFNV